MRTYVTAVTRLTPLMDRLTTMRSTEVTRRRALREKQEKEARKCFGAPEVLPLELQPDDGLGRTYLPLSPDPQTGAVLRTIRATVTAQTFETIILVTIFCSSAALAFDMPSVAPGSPTHHILAVLDVLFTAIFVVEMSLKLVAFGAFTAPDGYFLSSWNILDASIVTTSVVSLLATDVEGLSALRAMRALRALRPLRALRALRALGSHRPRLAPVPCRSNMAPPCS